MLSCSCASDGYTHATSERFPDGRTSRRSPVPSPLPRILAPAARFMAYALHAPRAFRFVQGGTEMASESPPEGAGTAGTDTGLAERGRDAQSAPSPAVRGPAIGRRGWAGASQEPPLAGFLGWLSVGLGASQLLMPRAVTRMIGVAPTRNWTLL